MTTLTERIRNGSGEDRELDCEIALACGWERKLDYDTANYYVYWKEDDNSWTRQDDSDYPPRYTSDLNAVFALVESELPGHHSILDGPDNNTIFSAQLWTSEKGIVLGKASSRCRALLLALLAAKEQG